MATNVFGKYMMIPVQYLLIDYSYQREVNSGLIKKIINKFDENLIGTIKVVSRKNGVFSIVDGQHRFAVLKAKGYKTIPCIVYPETTIQEEALMFHELNKSVNKLSALEDFWAMIGAESTVHLAVLSVIEKHGLTVPKRSGARKDQKQSIGAINMVMKLVKSFGIDTFDNVLEFTTEIWPANGESLTAQMLEGITTFVRRHFKDPLFDRRNAKKKFVIVDPTIMIAQARHQASVYNASMAYTIADSLVETYNKGLSKERKLGWQEKIEA